MSKFLTEPCILVLIAMEAEAAPFCEHMNLKLTPCKTPHAPGLMYEGTHRQCRLILVTNGKDSKYMVDSVGTTPAAVAAFAAINELQPTIVINAGTAGGFRKMGALIGDAYISTHFRHHDRRIGIPGFQEYGIGNHLAHDCAELVKV
jgi:5'-methylthioadenosine nucleosidase